MQQNKKFQRQVSGRQALLMGIAHNFTRLFVMEEMADEGAGGGVGGGSGEGGLRPWFGKSDGAS